MVQTLLFKPKLAQPTQPLFSFNIPGVDELFSGFAAGDFALLHGSQSLVSLTSLLCVRAQLPPQLGGLGSNVVFVDGGNSFRPEQIERFAKLNHTNPKKALGRIILQKAFTAYKLTTLILEKLEAAVEKYDAKLVVVSDIAGLFLESDASDDEVQKVFSQIIRYLANFAKEHQITVIATYLPHDSTQRNAALQQITATKANTVLCLQQTKYTSEIELEKHPSFLLGTADCPLENLTLNHFMR